MITRDRMMEPMLEACPTFRGQWEEFLDEWREEPEGLPLYLALAELARHLIMMLDKGETDLFPAVFTVVERWQVEGEHYVREAATIGLLESLQNTNLHSATHPEQFRAFLFPESEKWWDKLYDFWERGILLSDD